MAGGKGKSSGGKSSGGKTSAAEGSKKQQSHSARAGLQVSFGHDFNQRRTALFRPSICAHPKSRTPRISSFTIRLSTRRPSPHGKKNLFMTTAHSFVDSAAVPAPMRRVNEGLPMFWDG